ncbi:Catalase [Lentibacillus sp. JNUCC-1]|uniref:catalase n=1 Tax=Lentibacillus sp. JNUCC-1 TaxID=2654513 RepID=UPI0012E8A41A|nr:catalase [Lentibacillus sp. JNUCC-1]MUV37638.1 Catalase [Lentibacillus sp. JNUCC-1]
MADNRNKQNRKDEQLEDVRAYDTENHMTTNQGLKVSEDEFSLKAGKRGPTLMEDFHFREKMTHFDHERIPERVVHARGYAAHGEFEAYESMTPYTKADFLSEAGKKTPVFVRFSTVAGSKGSGELARDVRGFATKFYTEEGNYDLVGNNMPIFFIQDAVKFPDLVHAVKPEPHNEIPQAASAHDTFWDFVANNQEAAHHATWLISDRAIPRSFRMMEGFGVHTFRFVNNEGKAHFVKFHWKPKLGVHSVVWDEAQKLNGKNPDFHRQDLYEAIEAGHYPEWELGVQIIEEKDEFSFDFDILDPTKIWPEEDVPVKIIGKMTLNRNVDNVFAETEQVAFHPGHVVPGIDFTNDPLLQGRLFSYTDTQLIRLGGPNFHELPINRPVCPFHNNQRDGYGRQTINVGQVAYHKNSLANNQPSPASPEEGGYEHYQERVDGYKVKARHDSFKDHFSQATLFWRSLSSAEKQHTIDGLTFELGMVQSKSVRQQVIDMFANVHLDLARPVAKNIGVDMPEDGVTGDGKTSPALSQTTSNHVPDTRKVAVLVAEGFNAEWLKNTLTDMEKAGLVPELIGEQLGALQGDDGTEFEVTKTFQTGPSVLFDAVLIASGNQADEAFARDASDYIQEAFEHFKPICFKPLATPIIKTLDIEDSPGVLQADEDSTSFAGKFAKMVAKHRFWERDMTS